MRQRVQKISLENQRRDAFTLIELLAVVAIFALMAAMIVPNMSLLQARNLQNAAQLIADRLEFARQRTIVSGISHRLQIDLDESSYRLEWLGRSPESAEPEPEPPTFAIGETTPLSLAPSRAEVSTFEPMEGVFGTLKRLDAGIRFARVETDQGNAVEGWTTVEFEKDGTTDGAVIVLEDEHGGALIVEVAPLADAVRIFDAES